MFKVVAEPRKRRVWSPRTVAASVFFHLLLLAGFVTAAETHDPEVVVTPFDIGPVPPEPPRVKAVEPPPAQKPDQPRPVKGQTVQLPAPDKVPDQIPRPDLHATPLTEAQTSGLGPVGDVFGTPDPNPRPPTGNTVNNGGDENLPEFRKPMEVEYVDVRPELSNRRQAELILQRNYPPLLRDAGAVGRTTVQLIIGVDGKVEPGSVRVQESTHEAFNDAAVRAVERFRFKPAIYHGQPVAVLVTLPIEWTLEN
ncbi:MAG TPA: TonB family protein [Longimicrobium sp.]|nr:TonB family protein [Longimicrobium sp.]